MNTLKIHCKKQYKGLIDIRDNIVKSAIDENKTIIVTCGAFPGTSVYSPEELKNPDKISGEFKSKFDNNKSYKLYSYYWKID
jgi:hypothetical protein